MFKNLNGINGKELSSVCQSGTVYMHFRLHEFITSLEIFKTINELTKVTRESNNNMPSKSSLSKSYNSVDYIKPKSATLENIDQFNILTIDTSI